MLDPEIQAILTELLADETRAGEEVPLEQLRATHLAETARYGGPGEEVAEVRDLAVPGPAGDVPLRVYRPAGAAPLPVVAYLHGGGWAVGSIESFDPLCRALANASGAIVASVEYRLAPEQPFPAGLDDALAAVRWLAARTGEIGGDATRIAVAGDSAGGNLATVVARRLQGEVPLRAQLLIYPVTDGGLDTESYERFSEGYGLTRAAMARYWRMYAPGADRTDPDLSPLRAPGLAALPPAHVITAEADPLRDEGEAYVDALQAAGVDVTLKRVPGTIHGFWRWLGAAEISRRTVAEAGAALREALG